MVLMATRMRDLLARHQVPAGAAYHWDLEAGVFTIGGGAFRLTAVGTVAGDAFVWAWANDAIPATGKAGIEQVRQFGADHDLWLLVEPSVPGGLAQAKECVALAGRVLDAAGFWIDQTRDGFIGFVFHELPRAPS